MRYGEFESIMSSARMNRYSNAVGGNSRKAMTLYRKNLKLTQEMFTVISCFEVALRNAIDAHGQAALGPDWLRDAAARGGCFYNAGCATTRDSINDAIRKLHHYSHHKLVAELGFGFWRYMFARNQFRATGHIMLRVFPAKPKSTPAVQYNDKYVFNALAQLNALRNRMAHHEPICFLPQIPVKNTMYARQHYYLILQFFQWMQIYEAALLYGLDHINSVCNEIDRL